MTGTPQPIEDLDALPAAGFVEALAPLFEGSPELLRRLAGDRPFGSWWNLLARARVIAQAMPEADQIELLNSHPRLGAPPESVSRLSYEEQGYGPAGEAPAGSLGERPLPPSTFAAPAAEQAPVPPPAPPARPSIGAPGGSSIGLRSRIQAASTPPAEPPRWGSAANVGAAPRPAPPPASLSPAPQPPAPSAPQPKASPDEGESTRARLGRLNDAYEDWFGFRYCVFVAGRPLEALVPELEAAMSRPREQELKRGVDAVIDIAIARSGAAR